MSGTEEEQKPRGPPDVDHMFTVKVDNLTFRTSKEELQDEFSKFGEVGDVYIPRHYRSGESKGFGFVRFIKESEAEEAIKEMDGKEIDSREIRCSFAQKKRPEYNFPDSGRGRGGGYGRDRYDDRRGSRGGYRSHSRDRGGYRDRGYDRDRGHDRDRRDDRDRDRDRRRRSRSRSPVTDRRDRGRDRSRS